MKQSTHTQVKLMPITKTFKHVMMATLLLAILAMLMPSRSEAGLRISARIGTVRVGIDTDGHYSHQTRYQAPLQRNVIIRSNGRQRTVVRNDYRQPVKCGGVISIEKQHKHYGKAWVPGHYVTKFKKHGRQKQVWISGHWIRI